MTDELEQGLYRKHIVTKVNGTRLKGISFVLRPHKDLAARAALKEYARQTSNPILARDIRDWVGMLTWGELS